MIGQHTISPNQGSRKARRNRGRGDGSGRGSYSGRGGKGQTARSGGNRKPGFEGGQTPLIRRMPKLKGFKNINRVAYQVLNVATLNTYTGGEMVDVIHLYDAGLINRKNKPVKLLGDGELTKKFAVKVDACSKQAREKIEKAGGSVTLTKDV